MIDVIYHKNHETGLKTWKDIKDKKENQKFDGEINQIHFSELKYLKGFIFFKLFFFKIK